VHGGNAKDLTDFHRVFGQGEVDEVTTRLSVIHQSNMNFCQGFIGNDIGCTSTTYGSDVHGAPAQNGIHRPDDRPEGLQGIEEFVDGGLPQMGIGGMGATTPGLDFVTKTALGTTGQLVAGRLPIDQVTAADAPGTGIAGPGAVALLPHHGKQGKVPGTLMQKPFCSAYHGGDYPLGIATPTSANNRQVLAGGNEGGDSVHVSAESHERFAKTGKNVAATGFHFHEFQVPVKLLGE
jgi:hypothetical protein